jgi:hypothetical protein
VELGRGETIVVRKCVVKVVLSKEQKLILDEMARRLGSSESEMLRVALMDYAKDINLVAEVVHKERVLLKIQNR